MLSEYALTPDIFDSTCYSNPETCDIFLQGLKEPLLQEALVRDLRDGQWGQYIRDDLKRWHPRTKELIKKLITQNRLRPFNSVLNNTPSNYKDWCLESLAAHAVEPLNGVITSNILIEEFKKNAKVASIEKLSSAPWWQNRSPSVRLKRNINDYLTCLHLVLTHANSLMFIDPHLDPTRPQYSDFIKLLQAAQRSGSPSFVEIHRVCYVGSGPDRVIKTKDEWKEKFDSSITSSFSSANISIEVFIWDDFHDRYLITDIIGVLMPNGFDVKNNPGDLTTWTRLGREERDDIQREFDPAANRHGLRHRFKLI